MIRKSFIWVVYYLAVQAICPTIASGQTYFGNIVLTRQGQVDSFHYEKVTGNFAVTGDSITHLDSLIHIKEIGGFFYISGTGHLQTLHGLDSLQKFTSPYNYFFINNNKRLKNMQGAGDWRSTKNLYIEFRDNDSLSTLSALSLPDTLDDIWLENDLQLVQLGFKNCPKSVKGIFNIKRVGAHDLTGLETLLRAETFAIDQNPSLKSLYGVENLQMVSKIRFYKNDSLETLKGLESLDSIRVDMTIQGNPRLLDLGHFKSLKKVPLIQIEENPLLKNLKGLDTLRVVETSYCGLKIKNNASLTNLQGLEQLRRVGKKANVGVPNLNPYDQYGLAIIANPKLKNLEGLSGLDTCFELCIYQNDSLHNFNGLSSLDVANNIIIRANTNLYDLDGFHCPDTITTNISIRNSYPTYTLNSLKGLENLKVVLGAAGFGGPDSIVDFFGLKNLSFVRNGLGLGSTNALNLVGLENLKLVNGLHLNLAKVVSFDSTFFATKINSSLIIYAQKIKELNGFSNITSLVDTVNRHWNLYIGTCDSLISIESLSNIETIGEEIDTVIPQWSNWLYFPPVQSISVRSNPNLLSLDPLDKVKKVPWYTQIADNASLDDCSTLCTWLKSDVVNPKYLKVYGNPLPCDSLHLTAWCDTLTSATGEPSTFTYQTPESSPLKIYPNPTPDGRFSVECPFDGPVFWEIKVTDMAGRTVFYKKDKQFRVEIDLNDQPSGVFFIQTKTLGGKSKSGRIVKLKAR